MPGRISRILIIQLFAATIFLCGCDKSAETTQYNQPSVPTAEQKPRPNTNYGDITTTMVNGQMIQYYSAPFPLKEVSLEELKVRMENNDAAAMAELGRRYSSGIGVAKDLLLAKEIYTKAAEAGDATAQNELAGAYDYGLFGKEDPEQAVYWYTKAAKQGFAPAQYNIGHMLQYGRGLERNLFEALSYYRKSADQNFPPAQTAIGVMCADGLGVEKNYKEAFKWYKKASDNNFSVAQYNLGTLYENGNGVKKDLYKAFDYYKKSADQNNEYAKVNLGIMYLFGDIGPPNHEKSFILFSSSAKNGVRKFGAFFNLAQMYENGFYIKKSTIKAYALYTASLRLLQKTKDSETILTETDILDSLNTLKAQMTPDQIQAGEREIANVMQEYGVTL